MNRSDAWERFAQCRRLQPDALQVLVSADIVDALLADECKKCGGTGEVYFKAAGCDNRCPSCGGDGHYTEEAA